MIPVVRWLAARCDSAARPTCVRALATALHGHPLGYAGVGGALPVSAATAGVKAWGLGGGGGMHATTILSVRKGNKVVSRARG